MPATEIDVGLGLVREHITLKPELRAFAQILAETHQLPVVGTVQIFATLNVQQKTIAPLPEAEILAETKVVVELVAADTAPGAPDTVFYCRGGLGLMGKRQFMQEALGIVSFIPALNHGLCAPGLGNMGRACQGLLPGQLA